MPKPTAASFSEPEKNPCFVWKCEQTYLEIVWSQCISEQRIQAITQYYCCSFVIWMLVFLPLYHCTTVLLSAENLRGRSAGRISIVQLLKVVFFNQSKKDRIESMI